MEFPYTLWSDILYMYWTYEVLIEISEYGMSRMVDYFYKDQYLCILSVDSWKRFIWPILAYIIISSVYTRVRLYTWYRSDILCWMCLPMLWKFTLAVWIPYTTWNCFPLLISEYDYRIDINACTWKDWYELSHMCNLSLWSCFPYLTDRNLCIE